VGFGSRDSKSSIESSIAQLISMQVVRLLLAASSREKLNAIETVGKVVREQGPFSKLRVILVGN
jgi:hypothetical protein